MVQLIAFIIFIISLSVLGFIVFKKIPVLISLPQNGHHGLKKPKMVEEIEKKIKETHSNIFEKQVFLHRTLSVFKVWILKTENKVDKLLHGIRKKAQELDRRKSKKKV